jgi:iron complex outermembrane receptor protein
VTYGQRQSGYDILTGQAPAGAAWAPAATVSRSVSDGDTLTASAWKGLGLGTSGFLTMSAEYKDQEHTERGGFDVRQQYPLLNGAFDPRELSFDRFNAWYGEPAMTQTSVLANLGYDITDNVGLYGWAGYQHRDVRSPGFYRRALDDRNTLAIYPDGFLPFLAPTVDDYSAASGVRWAVGEWNFDTSLVYGRNEMDYTVENSLNRSLGAASPTTFDAGGFDYDQLTFNFSGVRGFEVGLASPLNLALGLEARHESYSITAGEPSSYINGGVLLPNGTPTQSGAQVFPGFRPNNVVDESRNAVGAYVDVDVRLTEKFLGSAALRAEHYSDFGENLSGKLAARYDFTHAFALRASIENGFRAPSLQQQFFATTSTNFIGGVPFDVTTFPVTDPIAVALGAKPLDPERALNYSLGSVIRTGNLEITLDAYRIDIDDRIVLSENLTQANVRAYLSSLGFTGSGGGRFFINGVDTRTRGVDLTLDYPWLIGSAGRLDLALAASVSTTDVRKVPQTAPLAALDPAPVLFDRFNVLTFEDGDPENKITAALTWSRDRLSATLRATRYGEVLSPDTAATYATVAAGTPAVDVVLSPKVLVDFEGRWNIVAGLNLALGAENLFDEYPDPNPAAVNGTGTQSFSNYSPFGRSGRFVYGRVRYDF